MQRLLFDITDADTIAQSSNVGAYIRAADGTRITATGTALDVNIASGALSVTEADVYAEDAAHASGDMGGFVLSVRQDSLASSTDADGDYAALKSNASGELYVVDGTARASLASILSELQALSHAEDAAHASGDMGVQALAVRSDVLASLADTTGDYAPLQVDANGALYTRATLDLALADTAILASATNISTSAALVASALSNRKYMHVFNNGNRTVYVGQSGVTTTNGFPLYPGAQVDMRVGASVDVHAIADSGTQNMRVLELS